MPKQTSIKQLNSSRILHASIVSVALSAMPVPVLAYDLSSIINSAADIAKELQKRPEYQKAAESIKSMMTASEEEVNVTGSIKNAALELPASAVSGLHEYDLTFYKVLLKCSDRTASIAWREERVDTGNEERFDRFFINPDIPHECQPKSTGTYKNAGKPSYDRGHILGTNAFDYSQAAMYQSNLMLNVVPQISSINRNGSWREVEKRIECMRTPKYIGDGKSLTTIAGVIWGDDVSDDYFIKSHGQRTPSKLFKIVVEKNPRGVKSYAWVFPNDRLEKGRVNVDDYLVSPEYIENLSGYQQLRQLVPADAYTTIAPKTPNLINGCDLS